MNESVKKARCPWCFSSYVWSYAADEYRCESCTREWFGSRCVAITNAGQCVICKSLNLHPTEMNHGCIICAANSQDQAQR